MQKSNKSNKPKKMMIEALQKSLGIVTSAAKKANINPKTHYEWLKLDPDYAEQVKMIAEEAIDFVETKMFEQVNNGDSGLIKYYLSTKGKLRGYVERTETDITSKGKEIKQVMIINGKEIEF